MRMANECLGTKRPKHPRSVTVLHVPGPAQSRERVSACRSVSLLTFAASSYSTVSQSVPSCNSHRGTTSCLPSHPGQPTMSTKLSHCLYLPVRSLVSFLLLSRLPSFKLFPDCKDLGEDMTNFLKVKRMES